MENDTENPKSDTQFIVIYTITIFTVLKTRYTGNTMTISANIIPISAFKDNYIWLFYDETTRSAWVVDPGEAEPVIEALNAQKLQLNGIIITHHHYDHSGGVKTLQEKYNHLAVYGSHKSPLNVITHRVKDRDAITCSNMTFNVIEIPGHTLDHTAFFGNNWLFCGDTLFSMGCGKIFEGTPELMYHSLGKLKQLPDPTQVFCGHEYTLANLNFAKIVEPNNPAIINKIQQITEIRKQNKPTLPSTLREEKWLNPFLRCEEAAIIKAVENHTGRKLPNVVDVFAKLREWKNKS